MLVGVYVGDRYYGDITAHTLHDEIWIPWGRFITLIGFPELEKKTGTITIATTIGDIVFDTRDLKSVNGKRYLSFKTLDEVFRVSPSFDQSLFAIRFKILWRPAATKPNPRKIVLTPDINAPGTSVAYIHGQYHYSNDIDTSSYWNLDLQTGGRVANGVWDIELAGDPNFQLAPSQYHWTSLSDHAAFRLGTATTENSSMLRSHTFTGMQFGWSNRDITPYFDQTFSSPQDTFMISDRSQLRNIEGYGPPAGIAELRFDGKAVARQIIPLDGKFSFPKVQMGMDFRRTEVYLYKSSILEKPVSVLDFSQSISNRALEANTLLVRSGIGITGNPLSQRFSAENPDEKIAYGHLQYGVNKWLTLDMATQTGSSIHAGDFMTGSVFSIGSNWNASAYSAYSSGRFATDLNIERRGKRSFLQLGSAHYDENFVPDSPESIQQALRCTWNPLNNLGLSLMGRREKSKEKSIEFLRPGGSIFIRPGFRFSATPGYDAENNYRYEAAYYSPVVSTTVAYESNIIETDISWQTSNQINLRLSNKFSASTSNTLTTAYLDWYPTESRISFFEFIASHSNNRTGASVAYRRSAQAGLDISLSYQYNIPNTLQIDIDNPTEYSNVGGKHLFMCTLTWDFGWSSNRFKPISMSAMNLSKGGIAGEVLPDEDLRRHMSKSSKVGILVNGYKVDQNEQNSSTLVSNLKPGLYKVSVDPSSLPVYVNQEQKEQIVEVKRGAITKVEIPLHAEYGVSGQVTDQTGIGVPGTIVIVKAVDNDESEKTGLTNDFGYYRINGLHNGHYIVYVKNDNSKSGTIVGERSFDVSGNYVFDVDIQSPVTSPDDPVTEKHR